MHEKVIEKRRHGGILIIVPNDFDGDTQALHMKYQMHSPEIWQKFIEKSRNISWMFDISVPPNHKLQPPKELIDKYFQVKEADERITEHERFIASLSEVDGAVVMNERFEALGFGTEIRLTNDQLSSIKRALDPAAKKSVDIKITSYGTRHRSAIRYAKHNPQASSTRLLRESQRPDNWQRMRNPDPQHPGRMLPPQPKDGENPRERKRPGMPFPRQNGENGNPANLFQRRERPSREEMEKRRAEREKMRRERMERSRNSRIGSAPARINSEKAKDICIKIMIIFGKEIKTPITYSSILCTQFMFLFYCALHKNPHGFIILFVIVVIKRNYMFKVSLLDHLAYSS